MRDDRGSWQHRALRQTACQASDGGRASGGGTDGLLRSRPGWPCLPCLVLWSRGQAGASEAPASGRRNGEGGWSAEGGGPSLAGLGGQGQLVGSLPQHTVACRLWGTLLMGPGPPRGHMGTIAHTTLAFCVRAGKREIGAPPGVRVPDPHHPGPASAESAPQLQGEQGSSRTVQARPGLKAKDRSGGSLRQPPPGPG